VRSGSDGVDWDDALVRLAHTRSVAELEPLWRLPGHILVEVDTRLRMRVRRRNCRESSRRPMPDAEVVPLDQGAVVPKTKPIDRWIGL
jgi:hypothetical protein